MISTERFLDLLGREGDPLGPRGGQPPRSGRPVPEADRRRVDCQAVGQARASDAGPGQAAAVGRRGGAAGDETGGGQAGGQPSPPPPNRSRRPRKTSVLPRSTTSRPRTAPSPSGPPGPAGETGRPAAGGAAGQGRRREPAASRAAQAAPTHGVRKTSAPPSSPRPEARCWTRRCRRSADPAPGRSTDCCPTPRWPPRPAVRWRPPPSRGGGFWRLFHRQPKVRQETEAEKWGSPLMLLGGGGLLVMLFLGGCAVLVAHPRQRRKDAQAGRRLLQPAVPTCKPSTSTRSSWRTFRRTPAPAGARVKKEMARLRQATQVGVRLVRAALQDRPTRC